MNSSPLTRSWLDVVNLGWLIELITTFVWPLSLTVIVVLNEARSGKHMLDMLMCFRSTQASDEKLEDYQSQRAPRLFVQNLIGKKSFSYLYLYFILDQGGWTDRPIERQRKETTSMQKLCQAFFLKRKLSNTSSLIHDCLLASRMTRSSIRKTTRPLKRRTFWFKSNECYFSNYLFFTCTYIKETHFQNMDSFPTESSISTDSSNEVKM